MTFLFQFWDSDQAPAEVEGLMASWAHNPDFVHRRYNRRTAAAYIAEHFDARTLAAYEKCAVPAMQSDFFRYCALLTEGGVYVDAGLKDRGGLPDFLTTARQGVLWRRGGNVANGFLFFRAPGSALLQHTLHCAIENIETEMSNNVWEVTGPGILTQAFWNPELEPLFDGFELMSEATADALFHRPTDLAYKKKPTDWRAFLGEGAPVIFNNSAAGRVFPRR